MAKTKRSRGELLPSGPYRIRVHVGDGKYKSITADSKKEAELMAQKYVVDTKIYKKPDKQQVSFREAMNDYIESRTHTRSSTTIRKYKSMVDTFGPINDIQICDIDNTTLMRFVNELSRTHKQKTVKDYKNLAITVIREKIPEAVFRVNVGAVVEKTEEEELKNMPNDFQLKSLIKNAPPILRTCIYLGAFCMMRESEIAALEKSDIDGNIITIRKAMKRGLNGEWEINTVKNKHVHRVIAPRFVVDAFMELETDTIELTPHAIGCRYKRLCESLGYNDLTFHGLRKFGASSWSVENIAAEYIQKAGGWKSDIVMKQHYVKVFDDAQKEAFEHMNETFEKKYNAG